MEVATAAGGSWPKRLFFEQERFIAKCSFGALSDQELFGIVRAAWGCLGRAVALWDVLGRSEALELSGALIARGWSNLYCHLQYIRAPTSNCIVIYNRLRGVGQI